MTKRNACQCILWLCIAACQVFAADEPRLYSGSIQVPTLGELGMTLGIQDTDEGTVILLTVPTQGATNAPLEAIFLKDGSMTASLPQAQLTFIVQENLGQTRLTGHMEQGLTFPIEFYRVSSLPTLNRPQNPIVPFPYLDREVTALLPVQQAMLLQTEGASPERIDSVVNASVSFYELMEVGASEAELREQMTELVDTQLAAGGVELTEELYEEAIDGGLEIMTSPWMTFFLFHDPAPVLAEVRCPVLALNGTLDVQVSYSQNLPAIEEAMLVAEGKLTVVELEGLNHLFQPATTGAVSEYGQIETTFDPKALEVMSDWVLEVTDAD